LVTFDAMRCQLRLVTSLSRSVHLISFAACSPWFSASCGFVNATDPHQIASYVECHDTQHHNFS